MVFYHSESAVILKRNKVMKSNLPDMWQSKPKSWCTRQFLDWEYETFGPQVKKYLKENIAAIKMHSIDR